MLLSHCYLTIYDPLTADPFTNQGIAAAVAAVGAGLASPPGDLSLGRATKKMTWGHGQQMINVGSMGYQWEHSWEYSWKLEKITYGEWYTWYTPFQDSMPRKSLHKGCIENRVMNIRQTGYRIHLLTLSQIIQAPKNWVSATTE